ncbi:hypothetical protein [Azospirillum doebereinerae]|uniref:Uncharacterized protein n=1 Tax=Azospirillum doebereinerae TaxID=92933 RepID=A0A433JFD6_9PROT|nr:hypothetical protein [Azospirillum doebereinerae]MCG5240237.1 hypothetical protein [Azospirillum doebereinerae]RUQ75858.1 hypothetical protein EJ913_01730 [Azospirillum doebereinerae]
MRVGGVLALRTGAVIAATVALAVLLSVVLSALKFEQKLRDVTSSRLLVVADEMRRRVEYGLTLGLDLSELVDLQAQVERAASGEEILGVEVVDDRDTILFAGDRAAIGQPNPVRWEDGLALSGGTRQQIVGDALILGVGVRNSFGQTVGEVVLRSSLGGLRGRIAKVESDLAAGILLLVAVAAVVTLVAVFLVVRQGGGRRGLAAGAAPLGAVRQRLDHAIGEADRAMDSFEHELESVAPRGAVR